MKGDMNFIMRDHKTRMRTGRNDISIGNFWLCFKSGGLVGTVDVVDGVSFASKEDDMGSEGLTYRIPVHTVTQPELERRAISGAARELGLENWSKAMSSTNNIENFFMQDVVSKDITSVSVGEVWLYFYKEQLICVRDLESTVAYYLKAQVPPPEDDGYTHRHEITEEIVRGSMEEAYADSVEVKWLDITDLSNMAFSMVGESIGKNIDAMILPNQG